MAINKSAVALAVLVALTITACNSDSKKDKKTDEIQSPLAAYEGVWAA